MSDSTMVNVRLRRSEVARMDAAAKLSGMSRSDFIRQAVEKELGRRGDAAPVTGVRVRGKAKAASQYPHTTCPRGPQCQWVKTLTGIKQCTTCGVKKA